MSRGVALALGAESPDPASGAPGPPDSSARCGFVVEKRVRFHCRGPPVDGHFWRLAVDRPSALGGEQGGGGGHWGGCVL